MAGGSMKLLLFRPCAAVASAGIIRRNLLSGQPKTAFLLQVSQPRNVVSFRPLTSHWVHHQKQVGTKKGGSFRCYSQHNVNDAGSIDSPMMQSMENKIRDQLSAESVVVKDAYGDGRHVSIDVISSAFEGQSAVNRQRMVYKAIWEELQTTVHAVDQMTTRTPSEAGVEK